ncbi:MAG: hypothetical protein HYX86_02205 [Chloroflexi bacterium]|nr:hypothetical protein [Chloroflexota bacterium]
MRSVETSEEFIAEPIRVDYDPRDLAPKSFEWQGQRFEVAQVLEFRQDWSTPAYAPHARG